MRYGGRVRRVGPLALGAVVSLLVLLLDAGSAWAAGTGSTQRATAVTYNSAVLNGIVNPNGGPTSATFEYGTVQGGPYASTTPSQAMGQGTDPELATAEITGLKPSTTYYFQLLVNDIPEGEQSFHTPQAPPPPPVQTLIETIAPAPSILLSGAPPSIASSHVFDLGYRVFCPDSGPACQTSVKALSPGVSRAHRAALRGRRANALAASAILVTPANASTEIRFKLSPSAFKAFRTRGRLPLNLTIVSVRGGETVVMKLNLLIRRGNR